MGEGQGEGINSDGRGEGQGLSGRSLWAKADEVRAPFHSMFDVPRLMESLLSTFRMHWDHEPGRDALPSVRLPLLPLPAKRGENSPK